MRHVALRLLLAMLLAPVTLGQGADKTIYVSVLDSQGRTVTGVTADDFAVREDGAERAIVSMTPAKAPLQVALLVDTTAGTERYIDSIRKGLVAFVRDVLKANPSAEIGVWEFGVACQRVREFTSDGAALEKELTRVFPRSDAGSVLLECIHMAGEALSKRPSERRAIVVFHVEPGVEMTDRQPQQINQALVKSRAQLWTLSLQRGQIESGGREALLDSLARNAGGVRERILVETAIERYMRQYAAALGGQYEVTYRRPSGSAQIVQTGLRVEGLKVVTGRVAPQ
jgi:VWFA-related protein